MAETSSARQTVAMRCAFIVRCLFLCLLTAPGCADHAAPATPSELPESALRVAVSIPPLRSLIEPLLPAGSTIEVILSERASPHADEMRPSRAAAAFEADLLFLIGGGADPTVERIAHRRARHGRPNVSIAPIEGALDAHAGHDHEHDHSAMHAWLDPHMVEFAVLELRVAVISALESRGALTEAQRARTIAASRAVIRDVKEVDQAHRIMLRSLPPTRFISHHGAFDAMLSAYGLRHTATLLNGHGAELTPEGLALAAQELRRDDTIFIAEPMVSLDPIRRLIASTDARVATLDPLGSEDWEAMMRANLRAVIAARFNLP